MTADVVVAARGGLCGGDGIPELTSGTPIDPGSPRSGVVEALKQGRSRIYRVAAGADIALDMAVVVVVAVVITTTTTIIITG